ncbi:hypothetical protein EPN29_08795 [bacterium]|nr:MAG: hypothetical protein EPN29_08795 [bacterium]
MPDATAELELAAADIPLTRAAREILERGGAIASARGSAHAEPIDVLAATLQSRGTLADLAIQAVGGDPEAIGAQLPSADGSAPRPIPLRQLLVNANREAQVLGHYQVDSIHLLLAMLYSDSPATSAALQKAGVTLYDLRRHLQTGAKPDFAPGESDRSQSLRSRPDAALRRRPWPSLRGVLTVSPVFLALVGGTAVSGAMLWFGILPGLAGPLTIVFVTAGWITSVCVHEFAHALVAYLGGDRGVAASGYLTLDPLRYTNVLLSLILPIAFLLLGGIGLPGGAVYINHSALRSRGWDSAVSVAGPAGTLLCGLLVAAPFMVPGHDAWITGTNLAFFEALAFLGFIEAIALLLNLVPVPGLDGFGILRPWLPHSIQDLAARFGQTAIIAVFVVLWYVAPIRDGFFQSVFQITTTVGIDPALIYYGQFHMRLH